MISLSKALGVYTKTGAQHKYWLSMGTRGGEALLAWTTATLLTCKDRIQERRSAHHVKGTVLKEKNEGKRGGGIHWERSMKPEILAPWGNFKIFP